MKIRLINAIAIVVSLITSSVLATQAVFSNVTLTCECASSHGRIRRQDRTVAVVTNSADGSLFWTSWKLGEAAKPWTRNDLGGVSIWLGIRDRFNGNIYETLEHPVGNFGPWVQIPGIKSNVAPAVSDGNGLVGAPIMAVLSDPPDGVTYINVFLTDQPPNPVPSGYWPWTTLAAALSKGNYMFLTATSVNLSGPNLRLTVLYQGSPYTPDKLSIAYAGINTNLSPAMAAANDRTVVVAVDSSGTMFYNWWDFGGGGKGWVSLGTNVKTKVAPAISLVAKGNYMFIFARGLDGKLYLNQGNAGGAIVGWKPA